MLSTREIQQEVQFAVLTKTCALESVLVHRNQLGVNFRIVIRRLKTPESRTKITTITVDIKILVCTQWL
jgi:hypothetical protein